MPFFIGRFMKQVHVAVGVVVVGSEFFLTRRHQNAHQGGKWEFPGGKVESNESVAQALSRELKEEIAIDVLACIPLTIIEHDYGDKFVKLEVFVVDNFSGEPCAQEGQEQGYFSLEQLTNIDFPEANKSIVSALHKLYS